MKIIKKILEYPCYCCKTSIRGKNTKKKTCYACNGTGIFIDEINYHVYTDKNGKQYCIDGDTQK
jgi:hypothetical protein